MDYSEQKLIDDFIKTVPITDPNSKELFVVGFVGPTGCGKSFVAGKIAEKLNLYISSNDRIRRFLNNLGFEGDHPLQQVVEKTSIATTEYLLKNKISHIIDADLIRVHESAKQRMESFGAKLYIIEIVCPEEIILERIKKRRENIESNRENNFSRGTVEDYFERKQMHDSLKKPEFFFSIDTSIDVDSQVNNLISKLKEYNNL